MTKDNVSETTLLAAMMRAQVKASLKGRPVLAFSSAVAPPPGKGRRELPIDRSAVRKRVFKT